MYFLFKTLVTALIVAGVSELAKRYSLLAAVIAALPIVSILTFIWVYTETKDTQKVIALCEGIAWFIIPTLVFFILFPWMLKKDFGFMSAMLLSLIPMTIVYFVFLWLRKFIA